MPRCPDCDRPLTYISAWSYRGLWGYTHVQTYECAAHGPVFVTPGAIVETESGGAGAISLNGDHPDRDAVVPALLRPIFPLKSDAVAVPEPDSD